MRVCENWFWVRKSRRGSQPCSTKLCNLYLRRDVQVSRSGYFRSLEVVQRPGWERRIRSVPASSEKESKIPESWLFSPPQSAPSKFKAPVSRERPMTVSFSPSTESASPSRSPRGRNEEVCTNHSECTVGPGTGRKVGRSLRAGPRRGGVGAEFFAPRENASKGKSLIRKICSKVKSIIREMPYKGKSLIKGNPL